MDETNQVQRKLIMIQRNANWQESVKRLSELAAQFERRDKSKAGETYLDIAQICLENGESEEAWAFAEKAMLQLSQFDKSIGRAHYLLAQAHDALGDFKKAKTQCEKAIQVHKNFEAISELHPIIQFLSTLLQKHGELEESIRVRESFYSYMLKQLGERGIAV
jgi:tetratricopeptide (TPR) repeat protein